MIVPLAFTYNKITWVGVVSRRLAAFSTAASMGPPGKVVIDLEKILLGSISLKKYIFGMLYGCNSTRGWVQVETVGDEEREQYRINSWLDMSGLE